MFQGGLGLLNRPKSRPLTKLLKKDYHKLKYKNKQDKIIWYNVRIHISIGIYLFSSRIFYIIKFKISEVWSQKEEGELIQKRELIGLNMVIHYRKIFKGKKT